MSPELVSQLASLSDRYSTSITGTGYRPDHPNHTDIRYTHRCPESTTTSIASSASALGISANDTARAYMEVSCLLNR